MLLVVHGGPGDVLSPHTAPFEAYESAFTVVQWDQRGAGRTYGRRYRDRTPNLTLERVVADGIELSEHLIERFGQDRILVLGHSWGTVIALEMISKRPDLYRAYIGTGQVASWPAGIAGRFEMLREKAERANDAALRAALDALEPFDPTSLEDFLGLNGPVRAHLGPSDAAWLAGLRANAPAQLTEQDLADLVDGMTFSGEALFTTQTQVDLFATIRQIEVPFVVIQGRDDLFTPTAPAILYFDHVRAPAKALVLLDAGHFALVTHPVEFVRAMEASLRKLLEDG